MVLRWYEDREEAEMRVGMELGNQGSPYWAWPGMGLRIPSKNTELRGQGWG